MMPESVLSAPFRVTDLKQWVYCPRILYYALCLPRVRPVTYKMEAGIEAGQDEAEREARRSLKVYGLKQGRCVFHLALTSERLGLRGEMDMAIFCDDPEEIIPVDYKLSDHNSPHFQMQLVAYGLLIEDEYGLFPCRAFLYSIPRRAAEEVRLTRALKKRCLKTLAAMTTMLAHEQIPEPTDKRARCLACEFRRFCNDVV